MNDRWRFTKSDERKVTCRQEALGECKDLDARVPSVPAAVWSGNGRELCRNNSVIASITKFTVKVRQV